MVNGARVSLEVLFLSVRDGTLTGLAIGTISSYRGDKIDTVIQRLVGTAIAFPALILPLIVVRLLDPSLRNVILVIVIIRPNARVVRSVALVERTSDSVVAARSLGGPFTWTLLRHIIPNLVPLATVLATTLLRTATLAEASLSFFGLGVSPPNPPWVPISAPRGQACPQRCPRHSARDWRSPSRCSVSTCSVTGCATSLIRVCAGCKRVWLT